MNNSLFFLITALLSLSCVIAAGRSRRRNYGFMLSAFFVVVCDVISFMLVNCSSITKAKTIFIVFYIIHALMYISVLMMISAVTVGRIHHTRRYFIPAVIICLYQIAIISANIFGYKTLSFSKHVLFGHSWWMPDKIKTNPFYFSFDFYNILAFVATFVILTMMVEKTIISDRLFRPRFYVLIAIQASFVLYESFAVTKNLPVWISCMIMNLFSVIGLYYSTFYAGRTLRDWSLMSFANEMNDGFILYDDYDDLIHMNDCVRDNMPPLLIEAFEDKAFLDNWLSHTLVVEGIEVVDMMHDIPENVSIPEDAQIVYLQARSYELGQHGNHIGTVYILHNRTESIEKIKALREANNELETAARMKSDFLANMSHEIRTPMNAVIGMAELALRENLPDNVEGYLSQIQNSGKNLLNIINDILDFSKIESGKMEIIEERYEPLSELNDIANIMQTRIGDRPVEFFVLADPSIPHALLGDAMRIRQVIINLANNAVKFTHEGSVQIRVSADEMPDDMVMLTYHIVDTGIGIKPEDLDKLFVSFQQVDSKRNRSVEGTGLGLAISKNLVEAMGGKVFVESTYGKGSDFYFNIPQKIVDPARELIVEDAAHKHGFGISDNPVLKDAFCRELNKLGVEATLLSSASLYEPTGGKDFLFIVEQAYSDPEIQKLLKEYPELTALVMIPFDSSFMPDLPNAKVFRRPETTLNMVMALNNKQAVSHVSQNEQFSIDFAAPDARILIVDDNSINITIAEGLLEPIHVQTSSAISAWDAIRLLKENDYDLILMDHMMPAMDGIEATHYIRDNIERAKDTPIIALTANVMEEAKTMFIEAGMNDFIAKPIEIVNLITVVKKWLPKDKIKEAATMDSAGVSSNISEEPDAADDSVAFPGLDYEAAIKAIGNSALYKRIVEEYCKAGPSKHDEIKAAYDKEDWPDYTIKVHALKSSSRQIGATGLGEKAARLESAGKAGDIKTIKADTEEMLTDYRDIIKALESSFDTKEETPAELLPIDEITMASLLDELIEACDNLDMDGMESAKNSLKKYTYSEDIQETINKLYQAIDKLDSDECMELIGKLRG